MSDESRKAREHRASRGVRRGLAGAAALLLAGLAAAPVAAAGERSTGERSAGRGGLLSLTPVADRDLTEVRAFLGGRNVDSGPARYGVRAYRLTYKTVDPHGRPTTATGLLTLPKGGTHRLDVVSDTHGTMVNRGYAPSAGEDFGRVASYLHASAGRAVAAPDYLGLGGGPGLHPYMDTRSSVTASVDMLRAARAAAGKLGRPLNGDVYATGFSQGGQVAMGLGRALREGADRHFRLRALAPVSGPYDLEGQELPALYDGRVNDVSGVLYVSYWLVAQNRLHAIYKDPAEVFRKPYAHRVERLFDGNHEEEDILGALAPTVKDLLTPDFYEKLKHPSGGLLDAARENDHTCDWKADLPVRLYAGTADTDVPIANARSCAAQLARHGAPARIVDQGAVDHFRSFAVSAPQVVRWFDAVGRS
ncbi:alpha/beta hydrolase [Streptomyces sp. MNP-20]|uniref:alpha/beta hydrolase n=1 Tax=Streptomyces sp. MNP-20 TaxID=2721165 RepID=UPI00155671E4|nr:alpha/beta hydrolase [Streptomyces sp. MNP-20]